MAKQLILEEVFEDCKMKAAAQRTFLSEPRMAQNLSLQMGKLQGTVALAGTSLMMPHFWIWSS